LEEAISRRRFFETSCPSFYYKRHTLTQRSFSSSWWYCCYACFAFWTDANEPSRPSAEPMSCHYDPFTWEGTVFTRYWLIPWV
jgi:hypothetical protein